VVSAQELIAAQLRPENRPEALRAFAVEAFYPGDAAGCRAELRCAVAEQIAFLHGEVARLRHEFENEQVGRLLEPLATLQDSAAAQRYHRYHAECRTLFHRSWAALKKEMEHVDPAGAAAPDPIPFQAEGIVPAPPEDG